MARIIQPFNENVVQDLTRYGDAVSRLISLSDEELLMIRSALQIGADVLYPDVSESIMNWLDDMVTGSAWLFERVRIFPTMLTASSASEIAWLGNLLHDLGGYWRQNPAAINDYVQMEVALKAGLYEVKLNSVKLSVGGKVTLTVDGVDYDDHDLYSAANVFNFFHLWTGIEVTADGIYPVRLSVLSKNASSGGYSHLWSYIDVIRLGDL